MVVENTLKKNSLDKNDSKEEDNLDIEKDKNNSIDSLDILWFPFIDRTL